jgi:hypothetical protein
MSRTQVGREKGKERKKQDNIKTPLFDHDQY